jgi:hypothetical protein
MGKQHAAYGQYRAECKAGQVLAQWHDVSFAEGVRQCNFSTFI